jgi:GTP-binding protein EngB required for normal cell division
MTIPTFAIIGHPNEGKSSVLSTLAEDDSVRVSPVPGETTTRQNFPVKIDGHELIRFIDTPGFQNPRATLAWMKSYQGPEEQLVESFLANHRQLDDFRDDCELLHPIAAGAGIIFVVDGSRPVRNVDRAEMEILRLTGAPRMAVINNKESDNNFIGDWRSAFRKHFNAIRIFNSCRATYSERIELLESLKSIDQQIEPLLRQVIDAFERDWRLRGDRTAQLICELLTSALTYRETAALATGQDKHDLRSSLVERYRAQLAKLERKTQDDIRALFRHNIFNLQLPQHSILTEDLFSGTTWQFLGLSNKQLIAAGAIGGATVGAGIDAAVGGASFGIGAAIGGLIGAAGTLFKGKRLIDSTELFGLRIGGEKLVIGPASNSQLLFILIDRCLLFYSHVINWAHGRRDYEQHPELTRQGEKQGYTSDWDQTERKVCLQLFKALQKNDEQTIKQQCDKLHSILIKQLEQISSK